MKKAVVIGSTGMVGRQLIEQLLASSEYSEIVSLVRTNTKLSHPKLREHIIDFDNVKSWNAFVTGDVLFSCLGTTIANAKTTENQFKVDYTYQYKVAEIAANNGVKNYVLVSSAGANANAASFYMQMKGKLDIAVQVLPFEIISILRPGQLYGNRTEKRRTEKMALTVMFFLNKIGLLLKYKPIHADEVAKAMITVARSNKSAIYTLMELFQLI